MRICKFVFPVLILIVSQSVCLHAQTTQPLSSKEIVSWLYQLPRDPEKRDELKMFLQENEIGTDIYYPVSLHLQECFAYLGYKEGDFPESERASRETLALPIYSELTSDQIEFVVDKIAEFASKNL